MSPLVLIDLAGSIALLLWGTHMVQTGVQRAFGSKLRSILGSALRNRFRALLAGVGVTAVLQSSTATGLMTAMRFFSELLSLSKKLNCCHRDAFWKPLCVKSANCVLLLLPNGAPLSLNICLRIDHIRTIVART